MVKLLHEAGLEVILDVVYNHTAEEGIGGPAHELPRHRQQHLLPAARQRRVHRHDRLRQHASTSASRCRSASCTTRSATGPTRCRSTASASTSPPRWAATSALTSTRAPAALRGSRDDPRAGGREADRRAVGRRHGRLADRQLPRRLVRVERPLPRHRARLLADRHRLDARRRRRSQRASARLASAARRVGRTRSRPSAARSPASTSSPRTTASRWPTSPRYNDKHNIGNGESNRDGTDNNRSFNFGVEGRHPQPADPRGPAAGDAQPARHPAARPPGVPMLTAGDEVGRTQRGNNNAYCQDSELTWVSLEHRASGSASCSDVTRRLIRLRRENPALRPAARQARREDAERDRDALVHRRRHRRWTRRLELRPRTGRCSTWRGPSRARTNRCSSSCTAPRGDRASCSCRTPMASPTTSCSGQRGRRARSASHRPGRAHRDRRPDPPAVPRALIRARQASTQRLTGDRPAVRKRTTVLRPERSIRPESIASTLDSGRAESRCTTRARWPCTSPPSSPSWWPWRR